MKRFICLLALIIGCSVYLKAQKKIDRYEYWFDNDHANRIANTVSPAEEFNLNTSISSKNLTWGLHTFHIRFRDNSGKWSSVLNQFFINKPVSEVFENKISSYRYWFDTNHPQTQLILLSKPVNPYQLTGDIKIPYLPNGMHTFNIQFRDSLGMWSSTLSAYFTVNLTGIDDIERKDEWFKVYPNPARDKLYISFEKAMNSHSTLVVRNIAGQAIRILQVESQLNEIDISDLPSGLYFVELQMAGRVESRKIVKK